MCEMPSCYGHEERRARKAHKCCECHGTIQPGEKYHYHHGVWDSQASSHKVCYDCEALRDECDRECRHDECTPFEGLHDAVDSMWGNAPELFARFVEIKRQRGATVPQWMAARADSYNAPSQGREAYSAAIAMREMIAVCADAYQPTKCAGCALFLGKSCPARRYLATCSEQGAWDIG